MVVIATVWVDQNSERWTKTLTLDSIITKCRHFWEIFHFVFNTENIKVKVLKCATLSADPKTIGGVLEQNYPNVFRGVGKLKETERQSSTTPHRPQCEASSTADAEDSIQHEINVGRKN